MELPNWLRIVLLLLSFVSFLPQLWLIWVRKDSSGLSLFYALWNLVVATELFTLSFLLVVNYAEESALDKPDLFVHYPPDVGDRINLAQFTVVCAMWVVIFTACLAWRSDPDHGSRKTVSAIYLAFLLISVVPIFADALTNHSGDQYHSWGLDLFGGLHLLLLNPVVNFLGIAALFAQARMLMARTPGSGPGALSLVGLAAQGVTFALLAPSWLWRLSFPWDEVDGDWLNWAVLKAWFQMVGFVSVDYAVFAIAQFALLLVAVRRHLHNGVISEASAGETEPLLGS